MLILALAVILTGCFGVSETNEFVELEFPVSETGFPTGFTRISDGTQIRLGMHRDEFEAILESANELQREMFTTTWDTIGIEYNEFFGLYLGVNGYIIIDYKDDNTPYSISSITEDWVLPGGISIGNSIHNVIDNGEFPHVIHNVEKSEFFIFDNPELSVYMILLEYNEAENIRAIHLNLWRYLALAMGI